MCVACALLGREIWAGADASPCVQELEAEAQRADKSTYDEAPSDDDRKRKGGGKGAKPAAKKSKY